MNTRKQKLEASLEGLFSPSKPRSKTKEEREEQTPVKPEPSQDAPAAAAERTRTSPPRKRDEAPAVVAETSAVASNLPAPVPAAPSPAGIQDGAAPVTIGVRQALTPLDTKSNVIKSTAADDAGKKAVETTALDEGVRIVSFLLNKNYYGVEISTVQTIIKPQAVCPVPFTPGYVEGLTNLRGQIVPIIDLRARLGFPLAEMGKDTRIIIICIQNEWAGIRVDSVTGVATLPADTIEPPSGIVSSTDTSLLSGIARTDKNIILILDTNALFTTMDRSGRHNTGGPASSVDD